MAVDEMVLRDSDLPEESKLKFHRALNPVDKKDIYRGVIVVIGIILFFATAPLTSINAALGYTTMIVAPYLLFEMLYPETRFSPIENGTPCDPSTFRTLVAKLNNIVTETETTIIPKMRPF